MAVPKPRPWRNQSGFTLLEVLVALIVLGLLIVGLTQGVRAGLALRDAHTRRIAVSADLDISMRLLRRVFSRLPVNAGGDQLILTADGTAFKGEPDRVSFVGELPTGLNTNRRAEMALLRENQQLILAWRSHRHEQLLRPRSPPARAVLLDRVEQLDLAYFGPGPNGGAPGWKSHWEASDAPQLIRIRVIFPKGDPRRWPDLIAAARF